MPDNPPELPADELGVAAGAAAAGAAEDLSLAAGVAVDLLDSDDASLEPFALALA